MGPAANCPGTTTQGTTDGTTCNGDGDGWLEMDAATSNEWFRFWQHLANAGLIEGVYNGVTGPAHADYHAVIGTNVPRSKYGNAGWSVDWEGLRAGDVYWYNMDYGHTMQFGSQHVDNLTRQALLTPEEVWNVDTKVDDGKPGRGRVIVFWHDVCADSGGDPTALDSDYLLSNTNAECAIIFPNAI